MKFVAFFVTVLGFVSVSWADGPLPPYKTEVIQRPYLPSSTTISKNTGYSDPHNYDVRYLNLILEGSAAKNLFDSIHGNKESVVSTPNPYETWVNREVSNMLCQQAQLRSPDGRLISIKATRCTISYQNIKVQD